MRGALSVFTIVILLIAVWLGATSLFTVNERQQAIVLRFGEPVRVGINSADENEAGLHYKLPWPIDTVIQFEKRNLEFDMPAEEIQAADQERLVVDAFMRYRIVDALRFYQTMRDESGARNRLFPIMDSALRGVIASIESQDVITGQRNELMDAIQASVEAQVAASDLGIEVIDVRIRRADLPQQIEARVFERMQSERGQAAAQVRAEGERRSREIRARAERDVRVIRAEARADAQRIRGVGDAQRNAIYAQAYGRDPEFFAFYRSMLAYELAMDDGVRILLSPDSDFFRYFGDEFGQ